MFQNWEEYGAIDNELRDLILSVENEALRELLAHSLERGGKRLRPLVLLLCCELNGGRVEDAMDAGISIELVHTASLIQDDIIDEANLRRGVQPTAREFGYLQAVMTSDYLISKAVQRIAPYGSRIVGWLGGLGCSLVEGELSDYLSRKDSIGETGYWELVSMKTARLFEVSALIGAEIARPGSNDVARCGRFGIEFGKAYQLSDDIVEYTHSEIGKKSSYHARTLPRILSERLSPKEAVKECRRKVEQHIGAAIEELDDFPAGRAKERLEALANMSSEV